MTAMNLFGAHLRPPLPCMTSDSSSCVNRRTVFGTDRLLDASLLRPSGLSLLRLLSASSGSGWAASLAADNDRLGVGTKEGSVQMLDLSG